MTVEPPMLRKYSYVYGPLQYMVQPSHQVKSTDLFFSQSVYLNYFYVRVYRNFSNYIIL